MKKPLCLISLLMICAVLMCSCAGPGKAKRTVSAETEEKAFSLTSCIAECEENGVEVVESVVSSDGLMALLAESESYGEYLQLYVYDKSGDCFVPMFEPQVRSEEVTAAEGGGFTVECDSGTYFVGKNESGQWNMHGDGTPFGAEPPGVD